MAKCVKRDGIVKRIKEESVDLFINNGWDYASKNEFRDYQDLRAQDERIEAVATS